MSARETNSKQFMYSMFNIQSTPSVPAPQKLSFLLPDDVVFSLHLAALPPPGLRSGLERLQLLGQLLLLCPEAFVLLLRLLRLPPDACKLGIRRFQRLRGGSKGQFVQMRKARTSRRGTKSGIRYILTPSLPKWQQTPFSQRGGKAY